MSKKMRLWMAGTVGVLMAGFMSVSVYALEEKDVIGFLTLLFILKVYENTIDFMYIRDIAACRNVRLRKNSGASYECCVYLSG